MQILSTGSHYVLTALILIGREPKDTTISATKLAEMLNCPTAYLSQLLAKLQVPGIIGSKRGANGGVFISRSLSDVKLLEVITTLEGDYFFQMCFLGIDGCGHIEPCPFHDEWSARRNSIKKWLHDTTLESLCNNIDDKWIFERLKFQK